MSFKEFNDSLTINMDNVKKAKETSWRVFGKYEAMNSLHKAISVISIAVILFLLHVFQVKLWGIKF